MNWTNIFEYALGLMKYVFLAGIALYVIYFIGLLRKDVD